MKKKATIIINKLDEEKVLLLSQKDLDAFNKGEKSYELINYLKDELIINGNDEQLHYYQTSVKAYTRIINALAFLRQTLLSNCVCNILDTKTIVLKISVDMSNVSNGYRRILNQTYNLDLPEITTEDREIDDLAMIDF